MSLYEQIQLLYDNKLFTNISALVINDYWSVRNDCFVILLFPCQTTSWTEWLKIFPGDLGTHDFIRCWS